MENDPHPQYNPRVEGLLEQEDPQPRGAGKMQRKLNKVRFESRPRKRQRPMPKDPIIVAYSDDNEGDDPPNNSCWFGRR